MSGVKSYSGQISSGERAALAKYREKGLDEYFPARALQKKIRQGFINPFDSKNSNSDVAEKFKFKPLQSIDVDRRNLALENIIKEVIKNNEELARIKSEKLKSHNLEDDTNAVSIELSPQAQDALLGDGGDPVDAKPAISANATSGADDTTTDATSGTISDTTPGTTSASTGSVDTIV